jgi:hypothetical protein
MASRIVALAGKQRLAAKLFKVGVVKWGAPFGWSWAAVCIQRAESRQDRIFRQAAAPVRSIGAARSARRVEFHAGDG